jgi:tetratricopeptide (TPR) repeat protein
LLSVLSLLSITLMINEKNRWWQVTYCLSTYFMLVVTFAAVSKGAWIVLLFGLLLLVIGLTSGYRFKAIYFLGIALCSALIVSNYFTTAMVSEKPLSGLWLTIGGAVVVLVGWAIWKFIEKWLEGRQLSRIIIITLIALVLFGGIITINQMGLSDRFVQEISEITELENLSYVTRADFMRWAVDIVKDYPIIGAGAGGWSSLYRQYQDYNFSTTETHSHILQVWVEAGTIGLLSFMSMWLMFLYLLYKLYRSYYGREQWITIWGIAIAALGLGLHSSFDFDLSIPSMAILLWSLFALISSIYNSSGIDQNKKSPGRPWLNIALALIMALVLLIPSSQYLLAYRQATLGILTMQSADKAQSSQEKVEQLNQAAAYFSKAVRNDPRNAEYWSFLAYIEGYFYRILNDQGHPQAGIYREQSVSFMYKAADLNSYNTEILDRLIRNAAMVGDLEGIIIFGNSLVKSIPNDPNAYNRIATIWWDVCQQSEAANQHEMAIKFAEAIIDLEKDLRMQLARVNTEHPFWQGEKLTMTSEFEAVYNQAQDFLDSSTNT